MSIYKRAYTNVKPVSEKTKQISIAKEEERKIASMGLGELKDYACQKSLHNDKDWYMTCVSCPGVDLCKPGKRVMEILEHDTKPEERVSQIEKFNARAAKGGNARYALVGRDAFIEVLKQPDPIAYLMEKNGCSRKAAGHRLYKWRTSYPDVVEQYGNNLKMIHSNKIILPTDGRIANNARLAEEARNRLIEAFTYPNGVYAYFENVRQSKLSRPTIRARVKDLVKKYSDLDEPYHISEWLNANKGIPGKRKYGVLDEENMVHLQYLNKLTGQDSDGDDEISVDDFLAEMDKKESKKVVKISAPETPKIDVDIVKVKENDTVSAEATIPLKQELEKIEKKAIEAAVDDKVATEKQNRITACLVFSEKRKEIAHAIDALDAEIRQKQKELADLKTKLDKLDDAAEIMGFVKVLHK